MKQSKINPGEINQLWHESFWCRLAQKSKPEFITLSAFDHGKQIVSG